MTAQLCIQVFSKISGNSEELNFFEAEQWTPETEKQLLVKIQDLLSIVRHCGESFEVKINMEVVDLQEAVFLIKKKINNQCEINHQKLSLREIEVLALIMQGYTNNEIAEKLFVSKETVKKHIHNIYEKLHVQTRTEALNKAFRH